MRDPGEPRRNPLFDSAPIPPAGGPSVAALLAAMQEAGPEATEHLLNAAHELLLAVKVVVDAAEHALAEGREPGVPPDSPAASGGGSPPDAAPDAAPAAARPRVRRVRRIDLAP